MPKLPGRPCVDEDCECCQVSFPELLYRSATFWYSVFLLLFRAILDVIGNWEAHECYIWPTCPSWLVTAELPLTEAYVEFKKHVIWQSRYGTDADGEPLYFPLDTTVHYNRPETMRDTVAALDD